MLIRSSIPHNPLYLSLKHLQSTSSPLRSNELTKIMFNQFRRYGFNKDLLTVCSKVRYQRDRYNKI